MGTDFDFKQDVKREPLEHFLARQTSPDVAFRFDEADIGGRRIVVLTVPAASRVPTSFDGRRFLRIGSSKVNLARFPEHESQLFDVLRHGLPTIENTRSEFQALTFSKLFTYYAGRGIELRRDTFEKNLGLLTDDGS